MLVQTDLFNHTETVASTPSTTDALRAHAEGNLQLHQANIEVYSSNPAEIGEHSDVLEAIQTELDKMSVHSDRLEQLDYIMYNL